MKLPALASTLFALLLATHAAHAATADGAAPEGSEKRSYKVLVMPYWNLSGEAYAPVEEGIARGLLKSSSRLAQNPRFELLPYEIFEKVLRDELVADQRKALAKFLKEGVEHGDVEEAEALLRPILAGAKADLLVFGSFEKLGGGPRLQGPVKVVSLLLFSPGPDAYDEPKTNEFQMRIDGSFNDLYDGVAAQPFWSDGEPIRDILAHGTVDPSGWDKRMEDWASIVENDRWKHVEDAFPREWLGPRTCDLTEHQRRASTLATDQLVRLQREKQNPRVYNFRGLVEFCGGNELGALARFREATQVDPSYDAAWYNAGLVELREYRRNHDAARLDAAGEALTKALELDPNAPRSFARRAQVRLEQNEVRRAAADVARARSLGAELGEVQLASCALAIAEKQWRSAQGACTEATETEPRLAEAHKLLGDIHAERRSYDLAVASYRRAGEIEPTYFGARLPLVQLLYERKRYAEAEAEARDMMIAVPTHSVPHFWLGKICEASGDLDCALEGYRGAHAIDPSWKKLTEHIQRVEARMPAGGAARAPGRSEGASGAGAGSPATGSDDYQDFLRKFERAQGR